MKWLNEIYANSCSEVKILVTCSVIFSCSVLICSAIAFYFAEKTLYYYDMLSLSSELIAVLRSGFAILTVGTVILSKITRK